MAPWFDALALGLTVRLARPSDLAAVDGLLARSYPPLLAADYPPSVMVTALPIIARARPELLASGRYFLAFGAQGDLLGAGGWSVAAPGRSDWPEVEATGRQIAHVRHLATDPAAVRRGVARWGGTRGRDGDNAMSVHPNGGAGLRNHGVSGDWTGRGAIAPRHRLSGSANGV